MSVTDAVAVLVSWQNEARAIIASARKERNRDRVREALDQVFIYNIINTI